MKGFVRHYAEMVVVMFVGMALLWAPADLVVDTNPTGAMVVPTLAILGVLAADVITDAGALLGVEHVAMFGAMLAAMYARRHEYMHHHEVAA